MTAATTSLIQANQPNNVNLFDLPETLDQLLLEKKYDEVLQITGNNPLSDIEKKKLVVSQKFT